jgi:hypothetical protein
MFTLLTAIEIGASASYVESDLTQLETYLVALTSFYFGLDERVRVVEDFDQTRSEVGDPSIANLWTEMVCKLSLE